jgi:deoxyribodipyrimidine photo-lyase
MRRNRRAEANQALAYAVELANGLGLPVLAVEALSCRYPHANRRLHTFALEGVAETERRLRRLGIGYWFHLERRKDERAGVVESLAGEAAAVVVDDYPESIPAMDGGPDPRSLNAACFAVDASCIVPSALTPVRVWAAYSMRPKIHKLLPRFLAPFAMPGPRSRFEERAPAWHVTPSPESIAKLAASCEIDHSVPPSTTFRGGRAEAERLLARFLDDRLWSYARDKNEPSAHATSELSPYLHHGLLSPLEVALAARARAEREKLIAVEFLEELIVRRELAFNFAWNSANPLAFAELPEWARKTLEARRGDARNPEYTLEQLETASTGDDLWNAAQKELLLRGKIHGYYRMYWGKKILEWSTAPEEALESMVYLNDRYALDGQDPNSYAGMLWCLGLHDRPWPQRPIYGTVRSMSRAGMERKTNAEAYVREIANLERTGEEAAP